MSNHGSGVNPHVPPMTISSVPVHDTSAPARGANLGVAFLSQRQVVGSRANNTLWADCLASELVGDPHTRTSYPVQVVASTVKWSGAGGIRCHVRVDGSNAAPSPELPSLPVGFGRQLGTVSPQAIT